jgi:Flp pilus assembly protein TadG
MYPMATARSDERGQTVVLITVFMFVLLGMCAMAIDVGLWYQDKRAVQATADASALAGASVLPVNFATAQSIANAQFTKNKKSGDSATIANTSDLTTNDSVTVTVSRTSPSFFAKLFGKNNATITATARATVKSITTMASNFDVMPWAVMRNSYTLGGAYPIYTDNSGSNNGAVSLPYQNAANCPTPNGANPYRDEISGALNVCSIDVGQAIDLKSGQNAGPTAQGLNTRITTWKTFNQIVQLVGNNTYTILDNSSKQLVLIPVVTDMSGGTTWPNGASQVKVIGFAWFVIESCGDPASPTYCQNNDGREVNGRFVNLQDSDPNNGDGAFDPSTGSDYQVELTS